MLEFENYPVFFNIFLEPLKEINALVSKSDPDYRGALLKTIILSGKLSDQNWQPFPEYAEIKAKLNVVGLLHNLKESLIKSYHGNTLETDFVKILEGLTVAAHLLNFLNESCNAKLNLKKAIELTSKYFKGYDITQADKLAYNCNGYTSIWIKPRNINDVNPEYQKLARFLMGLTKETLQAFAEYLFDNDHINKNSPEDVYAHLDLTKHNIFDEKYSLLKFSVEAGNTYKEKYKIFLEKIASPLEEDESEEEAQKQNISR